jgi:ppGpp synthetase/RelA/SpoT-type nucleotidyltranferase
MSAPETGTWNPERTFTSYLGAQEEYESAIREIQKRIEAALAECGIKPHKIETRCKDPLSLFVKQEKKKYPLPWADCSDLLGVRVIVQLASEKTKVLHAIDQSKDFDILEIDDKELERDYREMAYAGLHLDLHCGELSTSLSESLRCEVQIRTVAEHTWAETEHEYIYKGPGLIPKETQRQFARVLALVELMDIELDRGVKSVSELESYSILRLTRFLSKSAHDLNWGRGSHHLSLQNVEEICRRTSIPPEDLELMTAGFISNSKAQLDALQVKIGPKSASFDVRVHLLAGQPEALLVAALLDHNAYKLATDMEQSDLYQQIIPIARVMGKRSQFL